MDEDEWWYEDPVTIFTAPAAAAETRLAAAVEKGDTPEAAAVLAALANAGVSVADRGARLAGLDSLAALSLVQALRQLRREVDPGLIFGASTVAELIKRVEEAPARRVDSVSPASGAAEYRVFFSSGQVAPMGPLA